MIRHEWREVEVAYQRVDTLGYLYCHDCTPEELRPELEFATFPHCEEPCERCGRVVGEVKVKTRAQVTVEYFPCRIF